MARMLVDNLTSTWDPEQYKDDYNENLRRVIQSKMKGRAPRLRSSDAPVPANVVDLMERLKESLAQRAPARTSRRKARTGPWPEAHQEGGMTCNWLRHTPSGRIRRPCRAFRRSIATSGWTSSSLAAESRGLLPPTFCQSGRALPCWNAGGCSSGHGAHIGAPDMRDRRASDTSREGLRRDHAGAVWDAGLAALGAIDEHVREEGIDCGFAWVPGYLHLPLGRVTRPTPTRLRAEADARSRPWVRRGVSRSHAAYRHARLTHTRSGPSPPAEVSGGTPASRPAAALRSVRDDRGRGGRGRSARSHRQWTTRRLRPCGCRDTQPDCGTGAFSRRRPSRPSSPCTRATSSVATCRHGSVPDALFWDTGDPYRYLRLVPGTGQRPRHLWRGGPQDGPGTGYAGALRAPRAGPARRCCRTRVVAPVVRPGDRDARRASVHRRNRRAAVRGDRVRRQRPDLRDARRNHGDRLDPGLRQSLERPFRCRPHQRPRRGLELHRREQGLSLLPRPRPVRRTPTARTSARFRAGRAASSTSTASGQRSIARPTGV